MKIKEVQVGECYIDTRDGEVIQVISKAKYIIRREGDPVWGRRVGTVCRVIFLFENVVPCPKLLRILLVGDNK